MPNTTRDPQRQHAGHLIGSICLTLLLIGCGGGADQQSPSDREINAPAPIAANDGFSRNNDGNSSTLDVLDNDLDPSGQSIRVNQITTPPDQGGTVTIATDGSSVSYTPASGFSGVETFNYNIRSASGGISEPALVQVSVNANVVSLPPVAVTDVFTLTTDSTDNSLNVLVNDVDPAGSLPLSITSVSSQANGDGMTEAGGTVAIGSDDDGNDVVLYTPPAGFSGPDSFQYLISNNSGTASTAPGLVTLVVLPIAVPPVALPDVAVVTSNSSANSINVLANDVDLAGGGLTINSAATVATFPAGSTGMVSVGTNAAGDSALLYTPPAGFVGVETLTYEIADANGSTATGAVTVTVSPIAAPPVALPDVQVTMTGQATSIDALLNDVDFSGAGLTITAVSSANTIPATAGGTVSTDGNTISYTSGAGFIGVEILNYTVTDGNGVTASSAVTVTVAGVPTAAPPVAVPDVAMATQNGGAILIDATANDVDPAGGGLTLSTPASMLTIPMAAAGTLAVVNNQIEYTPAMNFFGVETLSYIITDSNGATSMGSVVVTVAPAAVIIPPVALPDVATVATDSSDNSIAVLANDIDAGMTGGLTVTTVTSTATIPAATAGTLSTDGTTVSYTPATGFIGVEVLSYTITDDAGSTAVGTVAITVAPLAGATPPVALADIAIVPQDSTDNTIPVIGNDIDTASTGSLTVSIDGLPTPGTTVPPGSPGTVAINADQSINYTPVAGFVGTDTIPYTITDGNGATSSSVIVITVNPLPLQPIAFPDLATLMQDSSDNIIDVLANDTDVAGTGSLLIAEVSSVATTSDTGTVSINGAMDRLIYSPAAGFNGVETLSYTVSDGNGNTATSTVVITVLPLAPPPIAVADVALVEQDSADNIINVLANDADTAGTMSLTVTVETPGTTLPAGSPGTASVNANNELVYTPAAGFAGLETLMYTITDSNGNTSTSAAIITVQPAALPNVPPVAFPDVFVVNIGDGPTTLDVLANDVDSTAMTILFPGVPPTASVPSLIKVAPTGTAGTLVNNGDSLTYTPGTGVLDIGVIEFSYIAQDAEGMSSAPTVVMITILL